MGVLKDIIDTIKDVKDHIKDDKNFKITNGKMKSISKMSSEAIMQFPVIASKTLSIEDITMASKALEREYATFIRIAITLNSFETEYTNPEQFIKRFHTNTDEHYPISDTIINTLSDFVVVSESTKTYIPEIAQPKYKKMMNDLMFNVVELTSLLQTHDVKSILEQYHEKQEKLNKDITENGIDVIPFTRMNRYPQIIKETYEYIKENKDVGNIPYIYKNELYMVKDTEYGTRVSSIKIMKEDTDIKVLPTQPFVIIKNISRDNFVKQLEEGNKKILKEFVDFNYDNLNEKFQPKNYSVYKRLSEGNGDREYRRSSNQQQAAPTITIKNQIPKDPVRINNAINTGSKGFDLKDTLIDNDVKKSNELVPTLLSVHVNFKSGETVVPLDFIIGVKTIVHPVRASEIIKNLSKGLKEKNNFFNFLRYTTGEIKFFKDFLLNIDGIRDDVISKYNKGSEWWTALKRRKNISKFRAAFMMKKQILPNATIMVSVEEANYLKNEYGIDLFNPSTVKELMSHYFLLGFVILDPSSELSYFLFDGYSGHQTLSYQALERENTNTAKEVKNIMSALGKI